VQYDRQVAATLDAVYACVRSERPSECTFHQESKLHHPMGRASTSVAIESHRQASGNTSRRLAQSRSKRRIKHVAIATGSIVFAIFVVAAAWIGISIYRIDHAIHHVSVPPSLISKHRDDLLVMVKGPDHCEQS
jgi:hypothetical protein